ncbi:hypothetical protein LJC57_01330 [Parabacteroides sp. OttesenSCG-928-G07]|nr:hypothetical protein [Parabacteroides sp. OttesenSCG-928-G07]
MIRIDKIYEDLGCPVIDFKFQNTGDATAFLWKFVIDFIEIEIDPEPVLSFDYVVNSQKRTNELFVFAANDGHGDAKDCKIEITNAYLLPYFTEEERSFTGIIKSGESIPVLKLKGSNLAKMESDVPFETLDLKLDYADIKGKQYSSTQKKTTSSLYEDLYISQNGFEKRSKYTGGLHSLSCIAEPREIYCALIDDLPYLRLNTPKTYKFAREIKPGDTDYFHIAIGCTKSAIMKVRFRFYIDKDQIVDSPVFEIKMWNPKGNKNFRLKDGEILIHDSSISIEKEGNLDYGEYKEKLLSYMEKYKKE